MKKVLWFAIVVLILSQCAFAQTMYYAEISVVQKQPQTWQHPPLPTSSAQAQHQARLIRQSFELGWENAADIRALQTINARQDREILRNSQRIVSVERRVSRNETHIRSLTEEQSRMGRRIADLYQKNKALNTRVSNLAYLQARNVWYGAYGYHWYPWLWYHHWHHWY